MVRVRNVIKHNREFTKSPQETLNYLLDILSPGSQQTENHETRSDLVDNTFIRPEDTEMTANICSFEHMEATITVKPRFNGQMRTNDSPLLEKVR